jgi:hypothetical protein
MLVGMVSLPDRPRGGNRGRFHTCPQPRRLAVHLAVILSPPRWTKDLVCQQDRTIEILRSAQNDVLLAHEALSTTPKNTKDTKGLPITRHCEEFDPWKTRQSRFARGHQQRDCFAYARNDDVLVHYFNAKTRRSRETQRIESTLCVSAPLR